MKKKSKSIAKLVEEAAVLMQKLVRLKAADEDGIVTCCTCGIRRKWNDQMDGGHFIERSYLGTKLLEENIHPQCKTCNGPFGGTPKGNPVAYTLFMIDTYGREFLDELEQLKNTSKKYTRSEIEEIKADLKKQIAELVFSGNEYCSKMD